MLRLSPPGRELLLQTPRLDVWIAGAEANVATALARLGHDVAMVSALPDDALGDAAVCALRGNGVDCGTIIRASGRMGLYWVENGAGLRAPRMLYDRAHSVFAETPAEAWDWDAALAGAGGLHLSGITPALGSGGTSAALAATAAANRLGVPVSFDGNYRATLWKRWDGDARETLRRLVDRAEVLFGNHRDVAMLLDRGFDGARRERDAAEAALSAFPRLRLIASTARRIDHVDQHRLSARIDLRDEQAETDEILVPGIVDRVGTGDAFAAGVLHALRRGASPVGMARTGLALAAIKHSIPGDATPVSERDLRAFMEGGMEARR